MIILDNLEKTVNKINIKNPKIFGLPRLIYKARGYAHGHLNDHYEELIAELEDITESPKRADQVLCMIKNELENQNLDKNLRYAYNKILSYSKGMKDKALIADYKFYFFQDLNKKINIDDLAKLILESNQIEISFLRQVDGNKYKCKRAHIIDDYYLIDMSDKELALFTTNHIDVFFPVFYDTTPNIKGFDFIHKRKKIVDIINFKIKETNKFMNIYNQPYEEKKEYNIKITCKK